MTVKQKQCLLCYLGYYSGAIDGEWGPASMAGTKQFQNDHGLTADGVCGNETQQKLLAAVAGETGDWWEDIQYFVPAEFACKCGAFCDGYPAEMSRTLVTVADRIRKELGAPVMVSSGLRCQKHNANVGGVANSRHLSGKAMDFCVTGRTAAQVLAVVERQPEIRYAYAIDGQFVHMDVL